MKQQPKLAEMIRDQIFEGFLLVQNSSQKTGARGSYLDMELSDSSAKVRAKMWDNIVQAPPVDSVVRVHAIMSEYNGQPQLRVKKLYPASASDDYDLAALTPAPKAPVRSAAGEAAPAAPHAAKPVAPAKPTTTGKTLAEIHDGERFDGCLLVRTVEQRTDKNNKPYLDMTLCDSSASINAKAFAKALSDQTVPECGSVLRVTGSKQTYNNSHIQLIIDTMRPADASEYKMSDLTACAPESAEHMRNLLVSRANAMHDEALKKLVLTRLEQCGEKLDYYPAASKLHHAEKGGLLHHTSTMLKMADHVCIVYPQLDADLVAAGVILHDLCKLDEMDSDSIGIVSDYTVQGNLIGHLVAGVSEIDRIGRELGTPAELLMMIEHMILSHHDLPEYGSPKPPMFPEAEVLHTLDLLDARMFEMDRELKSAAPGGFTDRIWSLDRKLYRRKTPPVQD